MPLTTDERLDALEAAVLRIEQGQHDARVLVEKEGALQREAVRAEGQAVAQQFTEQGAALLHLSTTLNTLQAQVSKWAAGGSLAGAVILFIAVRALGF